MLIIVTQAAVVIFSITSVIAETDLSSCKSLVTCPCGKTGRNITVCDENLDEPCQKLTICSKCAEGINRCLQCADGFIGPWCREGAPKLKIRRKRQNIVYEEYKPRNRNRPKVGRRPSSSKPNDLLSCPRIRNPTSGKVTCEFRNNERICIAKCDPGYAFRGRAPSVELEVKCIEGTWTPYRYFPTCEPSTSKASCTDPGTIRNGYRSPNSSSRRTFSEGSTIEFSCNTGYDLKGQRYISCLQGGEWSTAVPQCVTESIVSRIDDSRSNSVYCKNPGPISNGNMLQVTSTRNRRYRYRALREDAAEFEQGTQIEYSCDEGFILRGASRITCENGGRWSSSSPMCVGECGLSLVSGSKRITHGQQTMAGDWPWVVALAPSNNAERVICSGALVNSRTVVTAAHCLTSADRFTLYFGKINRKIQNDDSEVKVRESSRIIIHPNFNRTNYDSDIGIITFQRRINFNTRIQPICLPDQETAARHLMTGQIGDVTGWGITEKNLQANALLLARLPVHSNRDCIESFTNQNIPMHLTQNMFCAGYANGQQSVCRGDSGSPLVFSDGTLIKRYTLEGIVSFSARGQCGLPGRYQVFTKVHRFISWIMRNLS